jgi:hypothetical protein
MDAARAHSNILTQQAGVGMRENVSHPSTKSALYFRTMERFCFSLCSGFERAAGARDVNNKGERVFLQFSLRYGGNLSGARERKTPFRANKLPTPRQRSLFAFFLGRCLVVLFLGNRPEEIIHLLLVWPFCLPISGEFFCARIEPSDSFLATCGGALYLTNFAALTKRNFIHRLLLSFDPLSLILLRFP